MTKNRKFLSSLLLIFVIIISIPGQAFALNEQVNISEETADNYLRTAGYPEEILRLLELPQKQNLYEENATYVYHKSTADFLSGDSVIPEELEGSFQLEEDIKTYALIGLMILMLIQVQQSILIKQAVGIVQVLNMHGREVQL